MRLFISYSHKDKAWVHELWLTLRDRGHHDAWIDRRIIPAQDWWETILQYIEACETFIYIMTPDSIESIYCSAELAYAIALNKPILPIMMNQCEYPIELKYRRIQYLEMSNDDSIIDVLLNVERALGEIRVDLVQGKHSIPIPQPARPDEPSPKQQTKQVLEVFMRAEEAYSENNVTLAEKLFQAVIDADPQGYGVEATKRLHEKKYERNRNAEYQTIVQMLEKPALRKSISGLWRTYVMKYGTNYDPNSLAAKLDDWEGRSDLTESDPTTVPGTVDPIATDGHKSIRSGAKNSKASRVKQMKALDASHILVSPFEWIKIPTGNITIDYGKDRYEKTDSVPDFSIAKYPITNAQYQIFVEADDGYIDDSWWNYSQAAQAWRRENETASEIGFKGDIFPRTKVSWYESFAFCRWLSAKTLMNVSLPTEHQWQRAAQGDDGRKYAWGNEFSSRKCNTKASGIKTPTPVTTYSIGASVYGVWDMCGNIWEWTLANYDSDYTSMDDITEPVSRGGSFNSDQFHARCAYRQKSFPVGYFNIGFRIVCSTSRN